MMLDLTSLLIAAGFSAVCLAATLLAAWIAAKTDGFLLTCAIGAVLIGVSVGASALYVAAPTALRGTIAFALLLTGLATIYGTAWQFRYDARPWRMIATACLVSLGLTLPANALGYSGIGFIFGYVASASLITLTAYHFWRARGEAPGTVTAIAALYLLVAISFLPRIAFVILEGKAVIAGQPSNWAEDVSLVIVIAVIPGIGAMTMALNQKRLVRAHRREALTDPMTGLLNRRALFEAYEGNLKEPMAVVLFDIDHFKSINDTHGHATGDRIIVLFARAMRERLQNSHIAARLGGEEFALVMPSASAESALRLADDVRHSFFQSVGLLGIDGLSCSASAGIALGGPPGASFESVLNEADKALYAAKNGGRDRVLAAEPRLAG